MFDLNLEYDESIIIETENVQHIALKEENLEELVLTNKNLIFVRKIKNGIFAKATIEVDKIPLGQIKVYNEIAQARQIKNMEHGISLQVQFSHGQELFVFEEAPKKITPQWVREISLILVGKLPPEPQKTSILDSLGNLSGLSAGLKSMTDAFTQTINGSTQQIIEESGGTGTRSLHENIPQTAQNNIYQGINYQANNFQKPPIEVPPIDVNLESKQGNSHNDTIKFCANCGASINEGAKFCQECGSQISEKTVEKVSPIASEQPTHELNTKRQQEYAGKVIKCPNCGTVISQTTAICPGCGMRITGQEVINSVKRFNEQLMQIELTRKKAKILDVYTQSANPADTQKLSLIRSFPIPNTIDDIQEFMLLAVANIDTKLSKQTASSKFTNMMNSGNINLKVQKDISDAWVSKMQQLYQKAEIAFPNDPMFSIIKQIYSDKMKELKIKND